MFLNIYFISMMNSICSVNVTADIYAQICNEQQRIRKPISLQSLCLFALAKEEREVKVQDMHCVEGVGNVSYKISNTCALKPTRWRKYFSNSLAKLYHMARIYLDAEGILEQILDKAHDHSLTLGIIEMPLFFLRPSIIDKVWCLGTEGWSQFVDRTNSIAMIHIWLMISLQSYKEDSFKIHILGSFVFARSQIWLEEIEKNSDPDVIGGFAKLYFVHWRHENADFLYRSHMLNSIFETQILYSNQLWWGAEAPEKAMDRHRNKRRIEMEVDKFSLKSWKNNDLYILLLV